MATKLEANKIYTVKYPITDLPNSLFAYGVIKIECFNPTSNSSINLLVFENLFGDFPTRITATNLNDNNTYLRRITDAFILKCSFSEFK
jgi:hypothetical protein